MTPLRVVLLAIALAAGTYWLADRYNRERAAERDAATVRELEAKGRALGQFEDLLAPRKARVVDKAFEVFTSSYLPGPSPWEAAEKARHVVRLPANAFDVLFVPFQVEGFALNRSTRSLMSARFSQALGATGKRVPDSWVVLQSLGENRRQFDSDEVLQLAQRLGVQRVIWAHAGHDLKGHMTLSFRIDDKGQDGQFNHVESMALHRFENIDFSDEQPAVMAFESRLPEMLQKMGYAVPALDRQTSTYAGALPATPQGVVSKNADPVRDAHYLLMMEALAPLSAERLREKFAEKAMIAARAVPDDHPDARWLRARALMLMGVRPAALQALGKPVSDSEAALLALLNGNLPDLAAATTRIRPGAKRLLAELDLIDVRFAYIGANQNRVPEAMKGIAFAGAEWQMLAARAMSEADGWAQFNNLYIKQLLDMEYPLAGFTAAGLMSGSLALPGSSSKARAIDFSVHDHIARLSPGALESPCCGFATPVVTDPDYLELMSSIAFDNLTRRVNMISNLQRLPENAMAALVDLESAFKGHPHVSLLRADVESTSAATLDGAAKEGLLRSAYTNAFDALFREQGQTRTAADAMDRLSSLDRSDFGNLQNYYVHDVPFRPFYPTWGIGEISDALPFARAGLANTTFDTHPLFDLDSILVGVMHKNADFDEILKQTAHRFTGNLHVDLLKATKSFNNGDVAGAEQHYRAAIRNGSTASHPYLQFSEFLLHESRVEESAKVANSYPGLRTDRDANSVSVASYAYEVGSNYFWIGRFDLAQPLYRISADLNTGSGASIAAATRLRMLAGDFSGAAGGSYQRAQRYNSPPAYRDYLSFLHAMGHSKAAWDGFDTLVRQQEGPEIWESALVGHRLARVSEKEVLAWVSQEHLRNAGPQFSYAATHFFRATVIDRIPGEEAAKTLASLDRKIWKVADKYDHIARESPDPQRQYILGPASPEGWTLMQGVLQKSAKTEVRSDLSTFAETYRLIRSGQHEQARLLLEDAARLFDTTQAALQYLLPYLAFASAKSGNTSVVDQELALFRPEQQMREYFLTQAVLAGLSGKTEEAVKHLALARYRRSFTGYDQLTADYLYCDIVELLFEATGKTQYRSLALDWARAHQKIQPWMAWPYAVEAKLGPDGEPRRRAIAMVSYLDPDSERLKSVPKSLVQSSIREFSLQNPFLKAKDGARQDPI